MTKLASLLFDCQRFASIEGDGAEYTALYEELQDMKAWQEENRGDAGTPEMFARLQTIAARMTTLEWVPAQIASRRAAWNELATEGLPQREIESYLGITANTMRAMVARIA